MILLLATFAPGKAAAQDTLMEPIFSDDFEWGSFGYWSQYALGDGDLSVSAAAALTGTYGLQAVVDDVSPLYVQDDSSWGGFWNRNESYYHVSFRFDPNGFDPGEAGGAARTRIFIAFENAPQRRLFAVVLRRRLGQFALMGRVQLDDGRQVDTGFHDITDEPHQIELVWHRATSAEASDGVFRFAIDGTTMATLDGLMNHQGGVDFTRLGALSVKPGASGTLYWDDFQSARDLGRALAQLMINEVDYEQPGEDTAEFIEIYNRGPADVELFGRLGVVWIRMVDGPTHNLMFGQTLHGILAAGQYLVLGSPAVAVAPGAIRRDFLFGFPDMLRNGAPAGFAMVYETGSQCLPLDTLSAEGPMSAPLGQGCGLLDFVEGNALPAHIEDSDVVPASLIRLPDGSDTDDAATDWTFTTTPTPGAANVQTP